MTLSLPEEPIKEWQDRANDCRVDYKGFGVEGEGHENRESEIENGATEGQRRRHEKRQRQTRERGLDWLVTSDWSTDEPLQNEDLCCQKFCPPTPREKKAEPDEAGRSGHRRILPLLVPCEK